MTSTSDADLTRDAFLGGRVALWQPRNGFRSGIDAVFLAAAVPARAGQSALDLGCGAGAAGACLMARVPGAQVTGVEVQPDYADLARRNGLSEVVTADLRDLPADLRARGFDHVLMNPPYFDRTASTEAAEAGRDRARGGGPALLGDWLATGSKRLRPRGTLTAIYRAEGLRGLLGALPASLGSVIVQPLAPRAGRAASLVLLQATKGGRAGLRLNPPLILHDGDRHRRDGDDYSVAATGILRHAAPLILHA